MPAEIGAAMLSGKQSTQREIFNQKGKGNSFAASLAI